jgi:protein O-GlcNAc transferase
MNDLVVTSPSEYEALAVRLATHPEHLGAIRKKLAENKRHMPLFNTSLYTRHLEDGFEFMVANAIAGRVPQDILIPDRNGTRTS